MIEKIEQLQHEINKIQIQLAAVQRYKFDNRFNEKLVGEYTQNMTAYKKQLTALKAQMSRVISGMERQN